MGFLDKVKDTATKAAEGVQKAAETGQDKLEESKLKKKVGDLKEELGGVVYGQRTGAIPGGRRARSPASSARSPRSSTQLAELKADADDAEHLTAAAARLLDSRHGNHSRDHPHRRVTRHGLGRGPRPARARSTGSTASTAARWWAPPARSRWVTSPIIEEIVTVDDDLRRFQYSITEMPIPVEFHLSTIDVLEDGDGTLIVYGVDVRPDMLKDILAPTISGATVGMKKHFEA